MHAEVRSIKYPVSEYTRGLPCETTSYSSKQHACLKLYRAIGPGQLQCIQQNNWSAFPARLPGQPFFCPLSNKSTAQAIASQWNVQRSGAGFVVEFVVSTSFLSDIPMDELAGDGGYEYRIPAQKMDAFNESLIGPIKMVNAYFSNRQTPAMALPIYHMQSKQRVALM